MSMPSPAAGGAARALASAHNRRRRPIDDTIAFVTASDASGARRVMLTDLAGAPPRPVPNLPAGAWQRPRFSPDGKQLLLVRGYPADRRRAARRQRTAARRVDRGHAAA